MAGCFSIVADQMDEGTLSVYHAAKLCDEICGVDRRERDNEIPTFDEREKYIQFLSTRTKMVYDWKRKTMAPSIDLRVLDRFIKSGGKCESAVEVLVRQLSECIAAHPLTAFVIAIAIIWWFR